MQYITRTPPPRLEIFVSGVQVVQFAAVEHGNGHIVLHLIIIVIAPKIATAIMMIKISRCLKTRKVFIHFFRSHKKSQFWLILSFESIWNMTKMIF